MRSGLFFLLAAAWLIHSGQLAGAQQFRDPVAYCSAVGTIDRPDARYVGPKLPAWMAAALNLQPNQGSLMEWRCANKRVLACVYGANIPCDSKADTSRKPTPAILAYCKTNPGSSVIPMVVTSHETNVSWACAGSRPTVIGSSAVDGQGYAKQFWKVVAP